MRDDVWRSCTETDQAGGGELCVVGPDLTGWSGLEQLPVSCSHLCLRPSLSHLQHHNGDNTDCPDFILRPLASSHISSRLPDRYLGQWPPGHSQLFKNQYCCEKVCSSRLRCVRGARGSQQSMCGVLSYSELLTNLTTTSTTPSPTTTARLQPFKLGQPLSQLGPWPVGAPAWPR